jgi:hypothetical protein
MSVRNFAAISCHPRGTSPYKLGKHNARATLAFHDALNSGTSRVPEWTNYRLHQKQLIRAARREVGVSPILYLAVCGKEVLDNTGMKENASC